MSGDRPAWLERSRRLLASAFIVCALLVGALLAAGVNGAARAAAAPAARTRPPVPPSLTALESSAEDLVDVALAHDRARVIATASTLAASAGNATARALLDAGTPPADVAALRAHVALTARLSRSGAYTSIALASNAVSGLVAALYARFADPVPAAVRRLDYLDREAQLRSLAGQGKAVPPVVARLAATWAPLRQPAIAHGGRTVAAAYGRHVAAMQRLAHAPGSAFRHEAVNGLNLVDELETVFSR
jgi:hypothetical protein